MSSIIIIVKIEVSPRHRLGTPIFKPWKRSKMHYQKAGYWPVPYCM